MILNNLQDKLQTMYARSARGAAGIQTTQDDLQQSANDADGLQWAEKLHIFPTTFYNDLTNGAHSVQRCDRNERRQRS